MNRLSFYLRLYREKPYANKHVVRVSKAVRCDFMDVDAAESMGFFVFVAVTIPRTRSIERKTNGNYYICNYFSCQLEKYHLIVGE